MADSPVSGLPVQTTPLGTDIFYGVRSPFGVGDDFQISFTNLAAAIQSGRLAAANNLSDVASAATARTNLGLAIGTNVQAFDANTTVLGNTTTGTGAIVRATSPTLVTPALGSATGSKLVLTNNTNEGTTLGTSGTLILTGTNTDIHFQVYATAVQAFAPALIAVTNASSNVPALEIQHSGTGGFTPAILIRSPRPKLEFYESDETTPAGKYAIYFQSDVGYIAGRNAADNSFDPIITFVRPVTTSSYNGFVGIGANPYGIAKLTVGDDSGGVAAIAIKELGSAPSATASYGKIYVKSSTGLIYFKDDAGTEYDLTASGGGGGVTSVGLSVPTGFAVTGSPVTTSGTLALAFDTGYSLPTTAAFAAKLDNITGLVTAGTNVTITGSGTSGSPYVVNASGGGASWGTALSGTTDPGLQLTLSNSAVASARALYLVAGNTQSNTNALGFIDKGSGTTTSGLIITGNAGTVGGALGTATAHLTLWDNTAISGTSDILMSWGSGTSYTELGKLYSDGRLWMTPGTAIGDSVIRVAFPSSTGANAIGYYAFANATQSSVLTLAYLNLNSSGNVQGLTIAGAGSTTVGAVGTGKVHLLLHGNSASNANKVLVVGNETSFTERLSILASGTISSTVAFNRNVLDVSISGGLSTANLVNLSGTTLDFRGAAYKATITDSAATTGSGAQFLEFSHTRTRTATSGSITDDRKAYQFIRAANQTGAGGTFVQNGTVGWFENVYGTATGTLTDTVDVLYAKHTGTGSTGRLFVGDNNGTVVWSVLKSGHMKWLAANEQTTVGAAGSATAVPVLPTKYVQIVDSTGATLVVAAYLAA